MKPARIKLALSVILAVMLAMTGCTSYPPMQTESSVDIKRFMGNWYVIASIPTFIETDAFNAIESYQLNTEGAIDTTFSFREGAVDGEVKEYHPTGYVIDKKSNAVWGMQFIWPFKLDYRIVYLSEDYSKTVIGRLKRDYVWIMSRTPTISDAEYVALEGVVKAQGYDLALLRKVPQIWP